MTYPDFDPEIASWRTLRMPLPSDNVASAHSVIQHCHIYQPLHPMPYGAFFGVRD